jgi:hypothetical protein
MKNLNEAVGVPEGILRAAKKLYTYIINVIETKGLDDPITENNIKTFNFPTNLYIGNLYISQVRLNFEVMFYDVDKILFVQAGFASKTNRDFGKFVFVRDKSVQFTEFKLKYVLPEGKEFTTDDILNFIRMNEEETISTLTHELKHAFDEFVKGKETMVDMANYHSINNFHGFGLKPIRNFFHYLYLGTNAEILVKPSEVASRMEHNEINTKKFLEFLLNDNTYNEFDYMSNLTFEKLVNDLLDYEDEIIDLFKRSRVKIPKTKYELLNMLFHFLYVEFINNKIEILRDILTENLSDEIFGFVSDKNDYFKSQIKEFTKYEKKPENYFKNEIKYLNLVGGKMKKKLSKLYSITKEDSNDANIVKKIYNKVNHETK